MLRLLIADFLKRMMWYCLRIGSANPPFFLHEMTKSLSRIEASRAFPERQNETADGKAEMIDSSAVSYFGAAPVCQSIEIEKTDFGLLW